MRELEYPYKNEELILKKKKIKRELLEKTESFLNIKVAILAGSIVNELKDLLEIFLLNYGIKAEFYLSEYNRYYEDAVFENESLKSFNPDIVYVFTSSRNIIHDFDLSTNVSEIDNKLEEEYKKYLSIWQSIQSKYNAMALYIAPVSTYKNPSFFAASLAIVLLPAPAGPSMAMFITHPHIIFCIFHFSIVPYISYYKK